MLLSYGILQKSSVCSEQKMTSSHNQISLEEKKELNTQKQISFSPIQSTKQIFLYAGNGKGFPINTIFIHQSTVPQGHASFSQCIYFIIFKIYRMRNVCINFHNGLVFSCLKMKMYIITRAAIIQSIIFMRIQRINFDEQQGCEVNSEQQLKETPPLSSQISIYCQN